MIRSSSAYTVSIRTASPGDRALSSGMPSIPDIPGRPTSTSATSGVLTETAGSASSMDRNAPTHWKPGVPPISADSPSRISRSSSISATFSASMIPAYVVPRPPSLRVCGVSSTPPAPVERHVEDHGGAAVRPRPHLELAAQGLGPPPHAGQTVAPAVLLAVARGQPSPIVLHPEVEHAALQPHLDGHLAAAGVRRGVGHRFLEDQEHLAAQLGPQRHRVHAG